MNNSRKFEDPSMKNPEKDFTLNVFFVALIQVFMKNGDFLFKYFNFNNLKDRSKIHFSTSNSYSFTFM